jgi:flagellar motor switch protein FliG
MLKEFKDFCKTVDNESLVMAIADEHPQTIALIVSLLHRREAGSVPDGR